MNGSAETEKYQNDLMGQSDIKNRAAFCHSKFHSLDTVTSCEMITKNVITPK